MAVETLAPPLKWAGGKRWLVPELKAWWEPQQHRRLVEPMCGGLAVALGLGPARALLNDVNPHLINFYYWLQRGLQVDIPLENDAAFYYQQRERFNQLLASGQQESREAAQIFYYLNRTGFNGLCRFNRQGRFNVPFGRYARINYWTDFAEYARLFSDWEFKARDFEDLPTEPGDFIYADPPYDVEFTSYAREGFSWKDQERLAHWLAGHPGPVLLSNQATPRIQALYRSLGFGLRFLEGRRRISCDGDRTPALEVLAFKNLQSDEGG